MASTTSASRRRTILWILRPCCPFRAGTMGSRVAVATHGARWQRVRGSVVGRLMVAWTIGGVVIIICSDTLGGMLENILSAPKLFIRNSIWSQSKKNRVSSRMVVPQPSCPWAPLCNFSIPYFTVCKIRWPWRMAASSKRPSATATESRSAPRYCPASDQTARTRPSAVIVAFHPPYNSSSNSLQIIVSSSSCLRTRRRDPRSKWNLDLSTMRCRKLPRLTQIMLTPKTIASACFRNNQPSSTKRIPKPNR